MTSRRISRGVGAEERTRSDAGVTRAAERVELACKALSAAANDLRVAHDRNKTMPVDDAAQMAAAETERVCELAEELVNLAANLRYLPAQKAAGPAP